MRVKNADRRQQGSVVVEMALILIPLMFIVFGIAELGRGMWAYQTLATAVKRGVRFSIIHGARCTDASPACQIAIADAAQAIQQFGIGLDPSQLQLTLVAGGQNVLCDSLTSCLTNTSAWPAPPYNSPGLPVTITGRYSFQSVISSFWPGQGSASFTVAAKSTEVIQF